MSVLNERIWTIARLASVALVVFGLVMTTQVAQVGWILVTSILALAITLAAYLRVRSSTLPRRIVEHSIPDSTSSESITSPVVVRVGGVRGSTASTSLVLSAEISTVPTTAIEEPVLN